MPRLAFLHGNVLHGYCERDAISGRDSRIGGVGIPLARSARGHKHRVRADSPRLLIAVQQVGANNTAVNTDQAADGRPFGKANRTLRARDRYQRAADFCACRIAVGMQDAGH